jgi:hypothetical protein
MDSYSKMNLNRAIKEQKEYHDLNYDDDDYSEDDVIEDLMAECGKTNGGCQLAGTEYCDWECPFS